MAQNLSFINDMLSIEMLGYIFQLNSEMGGDDAYKKLTNSSDPSIAFLTLLRSSRVCSLWREIIINSPLLWGSVVNLNSFEARVDPQRWETLLMRTENAPLYLRAKVIPQNCGLIFPFLISVLERYWERMVSFDVSDHGMRNSPLAQMIPIFSQRAPLLASFMIDSISSIETGFFPSMTLFSNHAPRLLNFSFESIKIDLHTSWGSQIRNLTIRNTRPSFDPIELLRNLSRLPLLESLVLYFVFIESARSEGAAALSTPIHLPNLQYLQVNDNILAIRFLGNLMVNPGCCLRLETAFYPGVNDDPLTLLECTNIVGHYAQVYFENHPVYTLSVNVYKLRSFIEEDPTSSNGFLAEIVTPQPLNILEILKLCQCSSVKILELWVENFDLAPTPIPMPFARLFLNVEVLETSPYTLDLCFNPKNVDSVDLILPALRELRLEVHEASTSIPLLMDFFAVRKKQNLPMPFLHLHLRRHVHIDPASLAEVLGLSLSKIDVKFDGDNADRLTE